MPEVSRTPRIHWTIDEWITVCRSLYSKYPHLIKSDYLSDLDQARFIEIQSNIQADRRRTTGLNMSEVRKGLLKHLPAFRLMVEAEEARKQPVAPVAPEAPPAPPPPAVQNPYETAFAPLVELIAAQVAMRIQDLLAAVHPEVARINIAPNIPNRKLRFGVVGALGIQANDIKRAYPDIDFITVESSAAVSPATMAGCDKIIGMTDFMNHPTDGMLRNKFPEKYHRTPGSASAVKRLIGVLLHDMGHKQHANNLH